MSRQDLRLAALLVLGAFLVMHPYTGVRHDGILYAGDALTHLESGQFTKDLYFLYGSQGRFTVMPWIYAKAIAWFGLSGGTMIGLGLAFSLYLAASAFLVSSLVDARLRFYCLLSLVLGWTLYGGLRVFAYSESFLTARSFAEPAVLFALGLLVRGRVWIALGSLVVALVIHPLIGLGGLLVAWSMLVGRDRRWMWAGVLGAIVLVAAGLAAIGPFADVFTRYDAAWLALVKEANPQAFITRWNPEDLGIIVFDTAVLLLAIRLGGERLAELAFAACLVGLASIGITLLFVDLGDSAFVSKLQVWRAVWVMHWVAMISLPLLMRELWNSKAQGRIAAAFLAIGWMAPFTIAPAALGILAFVIVRWRDRFTVGETTVRLVVGATCLAALVIASQYETRVLKFAILLDQPVHNVLSQVAAMNVVLAAVVIGLWKARKRRASWAFAGALLLVAGSAALWDQRGPWTRKLESYPLGTQIWPGLIEPDATVYWYRDLIAPWLLLGHGNYYTMQQGSGAVFSHEMVVELDHRRKVTALLDFQEQICRMMNNLNNNASSCEPDAVAVAAVCNEGAIDYVVLQNTLEGKAPLANFTTGVVENGFEKKFYLYRCSALKAST